MTQTKAPSQPTGVTKKSKKSFSWSKTVAITCMILLVGTITTCFYFGYTGYQKTIQQNKALKLKADVLTADVLKLQQDNESLQNAVKQLQQSSNMSYYLNLLSTTDQLVVAANLALMTENNSEKAKRLLNTAIQRIYKIHEFSTVTQALENDINRIKSSTVPDREQVILQLHKVAQQINALNQALAPSLTAEQPAKEAPSDQRPTWQKIVKNVTHALRNVVTISHKENLPLALTFSQLTSLKLNLQALMLEAVWAVNNSQVKTYQANLMEVASLLQTYFPANEEVKNNILPTIQQLQQIDVAMPTTNLEKSLQLIETTLEQKSIVDITSVNTAQP